MAGEPFMESDVELSAGLQEISEAGQFSKCEIDLTTLFDADGNLNANAGEFLQLSCLGALRKTSSHFVPDRIYVRSEMKDHFPGLLIKKDEGERKKILTGSPGIGKSVLFFLAALRCQLLPKNSNKKVAYMRKVDEEPISCYFMEPGSSDNSVKVIHSQNIEPHDYENLFVMFKEFRGYTNKIKSGEYVAFVDGPNHNQKMDLLNNGFDFLCTSGGWPTSSQGAIFAEDVIILGAWTEVTLTQALQLMGQTEEEAQSIYTVSGGRIRLAVWGMQMEGGMDRIKRWYDRLIEGIESEAVLLAMTRLDSSASPKSSDRLRSRFVNYDGKEKSLLIVDSFYAMTKLRDKVTFDNFLESFNLAGACGLSSARGWFFEEMMHLWFRQNRESTGIIQGWVRSEGTVSEGVLALDGRNKYWIPATSNFATRNIDAAFLNGRVLLCLQYTVQTKHGFDPHTFWESFAGKVYSKAETSFDSVAIWFVSPNGTNFQNDHVNYSKFISCESRSQGQANNVHISFHTAEVLCASARQMGDSVPQLEFLSSESA